LKATSGAVEFEGKNIVTMSRKELRSIRRYMQPIYQDPFSSLNPRLTVGEIIKEGLVIHNIGSRAEREDRTVEIIKRVGLKPHQMKRFPHEFSGGQRQRIAIARALVLQPKFVVADEPVSALDVSIQAQIINLLIELQEELKLTYLVIGHDLAVVEHISDTIAVMYLGSIMELAKDKDLYSSPMHPYTQALLSAIPNVNPHEKKTRIILKGDVPSPINPPTGCPFHPRCFRGMRICSQEPPPVIDLGGNHLVSCFHYV
jgi:oligopeptide/dipeptide ABC transporter ATP-binding protein